MHQPVQIGLLGLGTVGSGVVHILQSNGSNLTAKAGAPLQLRRIAVRDVTRPRGVVVDKDMLTDNPDDVVRDPDIDIIVEAMGGVEPARTLITEALQRGKHVVTANKELIARHGPELLTLGQRYGAGLYYEASVAGGVPIVRPLKACLAANRLRSISGIINGTTNFMLTRMTAEKRGFDEMLQHAQRLGYAEADPTSDVEGHDAAFKIAILAGLAFDAQVDVGDVHCEGITRITPEDIRHGQELGYTLKLLAIAEEAEERIDIRVHPTFIPMDHPLATVNDAFNAIFVRGDAVGDLMFYGRGAGALPTGSAVVADVLDAARHKLSGGNRVAGPPSRRPTIVPIGDTIARYYVSFHVVNKPGVLGRVASAFGDAGVSLDSVIRKSMEDDTDERFVTLVVVTHEAPYAKLKTALERIRGFSDVHDVGNVIRVQESEQ